MPRLAHSNVFNFAKGLTALAILVVALGFFGVLRAEAADCCYQPQGSLCFNNKGSAWCSVLQSGPNPAQFHATNGCSDIPICNATGRCQDPNNSTSCVDSQLWECQQDHAGWTFSAGVTCNSGTPQGTCCEHVQTTANGTKSVCNNGVASTNCPAPANFYNTACQQVASCTTGTISGGPTTPATPKSVPTIFSPEVTIPGLFDKDVEVTGETIGQYIRAVFVYFIWIVGVLAVVMVIYGGIKWVAAAGNPGRINDARDQVNSAIIGLIIALTSVLLLTIINPNLTSFSGLTIKPISPKVREFSEQLVDTVGSFPSCTATSVSGSPTTACSRFGCDSALNGWVNNAAKKYGVGAIYIKSFLMLESKKDNRNGQQVLVSANTNLPDGTGSGRTGSAYGIGQMVQGTLYNELKSTVGLPGECPSGANARQPSGQLNDSCAQWLDRRMELQVELTSHLLASTLKLRCVSGSPILAAAAYHLGSGALKGYCEGENGDIYDVPKAANYLNSLKQFFITQCSNSGGTANSFGTTGSF